MPERHSLMGTSSLCLLFVPFIVVVVFAVVIVVVVESSRMVAASSLICGELMIVGISLQSLILVMDVSPPPFPKYI
jgi:hypothetical protein